MTSKLWQRTSKKVAMSFSVYETKNGCLPIPSSCFSKCVLNSFFKETQAVELVSTCFSVPFCFLINYNSLVMKQGYQSRSFNIDDSAVSFRKLTTAVSTRSVLLSSRITTRQHIRIAYSFSTHSYNEFWWLINPVNWFFTRVLSEILNYNLSISIITFIQRLLQYETLACTPLWIDSSPWSSGVYFLLILSRKNSEIKFILGQKKFLQRNLKTEVIVRKIPGFYCNIVV